MTLLYNTGVKTIYVKRHSPKTNIWIVVCEYDRPSKKPQTVCQVFDEFHARELRLMFCKMYGLNPNIVDKRDWFAIKGQLALEQDKVFHKLNNVAQRQVKTIKRSEREELHDLVAQMLEIGSVVKL